MYRPIVFISHIAEYMLYDLCIRYIMLYFATCDMFMIIHDLLVLFPNFMIVKERVAPTITWQFSAVTCSICYAMQSWCDILVLRLRTEAERITSSLGEGCDETLSSAFIILGDNLVVMMSESDGTPWYHIIHDHMYVCILILLHVFDIMICGCHNVAISHYLFYGFFTIVTTWSWRFHFVYREHLNVLPLFHIWIFVCMKYNIISVLSAGFPLDDDDIQVTQSL